MSLFRLSPLGLAGLARGVAANRLPLARNERKPLFNWSMTEDTKGIRFGIGVEPPLHFGRFSMVRRHN